MDLFSGNISQLRKAKKLTQAGLAKDLHISHQAVSKWEKGKSIPDAEMLTSIARYFGVTVDRLLNEKIHIYQPPVFPMAPVYAPPQTEETGESVLRTKNPRGALFLIPMFVLFVVVLFLPLAEVFRYSLTQFDARNGSYVFGFDHFINLFSLDEVFRIALKNTFWNALAATLICGPLAFATSRLVQTVHKALKYTEILLFDLLSLFMLAGGGWAYLLSGDAYGFINGRLVDSGIIAEPIPFLLDPKVIALLQPMLVCVILFGPILSVLSVMKPRTVPTNKLLKVLFPIRYSTLIYVAVGLPVLLMSVCWSAMLTTFGLPSADYAAHTITAHLVEYTLIRTQFWYADAVDVASLFFTLAFLLISFTLSCIIMNLVAFVKGRLSAAESYPRPVRQSKKTAAYILCGIAVVLGLFLLFPLFIDRKSTRLNSSH